MTKEFQSLIDEVNKEVRKERKGKSSRMPKVPNNHGEYKFDVVRNGVYKILPSELRCYELDFRSYGFEEAIDYLYRLAVKLNLPIITISGNRTVDESMLQILERRSFQILSDKNLSTLFGGNGSYLYCDLSNGKLIELAPFINNIKRYFYALNEKDYFRFESINAGKAFSLRYFYRIYSAELHFDWDGENCIISNSQGEILKSFSNTKDAIKNVKEILREEYQLKQVENMIEPSTKLFEEKLKNSAKVDESTSKKIFKCLLSQMDGEEIELKIGNSGFDYTKDDKTGLYFLYVYNNYFVFLNGGEVFHFLEKNRAFEKYIKISLEIKKKQVESELNYSWKSWNK